MKKGVQMYTVREYLNTEKELLETYQKIKNIGYDCVQTWTPDFLSHQQLKEILDSIGLESCSANGDYDVMLQNPAAIEAAVEEAKIFGVDSIAIGTLPSEFRESEDGFKRFAQNINQICARLKQEHMKLLYHPHALEFFSLGGGLKGMDILLNDTDPDAFHFTLDTHWLTCGGVNAADWIRKANGRMNMIHFKDYAIIGGASTIETVCKRFAEVGEGNIDWPSIISACREIGIEQVIVEQDICTRNPFDCITTSFQNMVRLCV